jgi:tetratricopeptide (TPR) repeat protein/tRNA A-37 threonylcarbamoyl transferase component Bud32
MPDTIATIDEALSPAQAVHINDVCDRFEAAWKAAGPGGPPPPIEEHVGDTPEPERAVLLRHLILLEIDYRLLRGENPSPEDYRSRFPALSARFLADVIPAPAAERPAAKESAGEGQQDGVEEVQTTVLPRPVVPPMRSDRYVVRQFHAQGGIGEVWLADDAEIGRPVALKRLRKKCDEQQGRFLAEAQITGQLEHPGIVPVHDLGLDEDGRPFYVMTFVHGRTLKDAIDEYHAGSRTASEAAEVGLCRLLETFVQVCQAAAYAHSRGVIHRDLKPDNVMLGEYGETLVLDWGLAKVRSQPESPGSRSSVQLTYSSGSTETQAGMVMGSPAYMAPEVADGRAADADERTDVYLLGATLYHILTGQVPRRGSSRAELVDLARTVPPPPPRQLRADVPRALEAVCLKAMAQRKAHRYAGALDVAADVQRYLAGVPVAAYPEPVPAQVWRWCKRHRRVLGRSAAAAVVAGLALFGAALVREAWRSAEAARRDADELRLRQQADRDLKEFRRLSEERQFYAALTTPAGDQRVQYDSPRVEAAGKKALEVAGRLTGEMGRLPGEADAFHKEFHDLLLLLGDEPRAGEELRRVRDRGAHASALEHFLAAERHRARAASPTAAGGDGADWRPSADELHKAIAEYKEALRIEPQHYWSYFQMGRCYLSLGRGTEAVEALGTCVALRPDRPWAYSARGLTLGLIKRFPEGEADLEKTLELEKDFRPALLNRGILAWLQGKEDRALADFAEVLKPPEEKRLIEAAYYRGQLHLERGRLEEARRNFDLVAQENPAFRPVYLSRAQVHFLREDPEQGLADLRRFLDLARLTPHDPSGPDVFALRGRLLRHLVPGWGLGPAEVRAKLQPARAQLVKAVELGGRSPELFDDLGAVLELLGEPDKALEAYEKALNAAPPDRKDLKVKVLLRRGQICAQFLRPPQYDRAREALDAVLRLDPTNKEAHAQLGYLHVLQRSPGEAQREAAQALLHGGGDYLILHWVACIYAGLSRIDPGQASKHQDMAMALINRAVELWRQGGPGPNELALIRGEEAFRPLKDRPEFVRLLKGG